MGEWVSEGVRDSRLTCLPVGLDSRARSCSITSIHWTGQKSKYTEWVIVFSYFSFWLPSG